jgi:hypothetical protein
MVIKDYVVLQNPQEQVNRLSPPRILDFTMTHTQRLDPKEVRDKIRHYRQNYLNRPDPLDFMSVTVDTSGPRLTIKLFGGY